MRGNSASASVELAMVTPVFVLFSAAIADFSLAYHQQLQLASALSAGAEYAFTTGQSNRGRRSPRLSRTSCKRFRQYI
jgi:Flp pilus assembly protein TadG